ncbi:MAG: hypothetical protein EZS28_043323, partial [Streblomastix strix]
ANGTDKELLGELFVQSVDPTFKFNNKQKKKKEQETQIHT